MEDFLESLILSGAVEVAGIDSETGEMLYAFTPKLAEIYPHLARAADEHFHSQMMALWVKEVISMDVSSSNPTVRLTEKAFDEGVLSQLTQMERETLSMIMQALKKES